MALFIDFPKQKSKDSWKDNVGTIRSGRLDPHSERPYSLPSWRFTADTNEICQTIADKYGGEVGEWQTKKSDRFEVITDAEVLGVQLLTFRSEMILWGSHGPMRVCDGKTRTDDKHDGEACKCAADFPSMWDRKEAARGQGEACKPNLQATMKLLDFPDLGIFNWTSSAWMIAEDYANWLEEIAGAQGNISMTIEGYKTKAGQSRQKTVFDLIESEKASA